MNSKLVEYSPQAIANIQTVEEAKDGYEKLKTLVSYFRDDYDQAFSFAVASCECFGKMGELIEEMQENGELEGKGGDRKSKSSPRTLKLEDIDISKNESAESQRINKLLPFEKRQEYYDKVRERISLPCKAGLLQMIARERKPEPAETPEIPTGKYRCIVLDPPWPIKKIEREVIPNQGVELDYPTMTLEDITALPVNNLADEDGCHLYLWVTQKYLPAGLEMVSQWGFKYQCLMTWVKNVGFTPFSWMYDTEHVIFATCGNLKLNQMGLKLSFNAPRTKHSVKPDIFYNERVILASPEPRLEMFARREREGFSVWGNEVNEEKS